MRVCMYCIAALFLLFKHLCTIGSDNKDDSTNNSQETQVVEPTSAGTVYLDTHTLRNVFLVGSDKESSQSVSRDQSCSDIITNCSLPPSLSEGTLMMM